METSVRSRRNNKKNDSTIKKEALLDDVVLKKNVEEKLKLVNSKEKRDSGDGESEPATPPNEFGDTDSPNGLSTPKTILKNGDSKQKTGSSKLQKSSPKLKVTQKGDEREDAEFQFSVDAMAVLLFVVSFAVRAFRLDSPNGVVFDELHYGKYVGHYMKNTFFFDTQPPLGKQLIAIVAYFLGYTGEFKFERIGSPYDSTVPVQALRLVPAIFGSLLSPVVYKLMQELKARKATAFLAAGIVAIDTAMVIQTRHMFLEGPLLFFGLFGILCVLRLRRYYYRPYSLPWWWYMCLSAASLTAAACVRYFGLFTFLLGLIILTYDYWQMVADKLVTDRQLLYHCMTRCLVFSTIPVLLYLSCFYVHLSLLYKAGPNDNVMTSSFQTSLEGGLASIVANQPLQVVHGSQVTLRHSHGKACWLHSHDELYPAKYADDRGSSHQQQVTCYTYKDVNNWWIVKRHDEDEVVVNEPVDPIKNGDIIQLIHGLTTRTLNSHDVASAMSPHNQEVSCYVDHNVSMSAQNLWRVELLNPEKTNNMWRAVESQFRLIHVNTSTALKYSGRQLPEWGFKQHEIVTDKAINQQDTIWNVEEHRYSRTDDKKERRSEIINSEMIPTERQNLTFLDKFYELQFKMIFNSLENVAGHMYASDPIDWLFLSRGVAYWIDSESNAQIHFVGNIVAWLSGTAALAVYVTLLVFYILRRHRACYDIPEDAWLKFCDVGIVMVTGYLVHYLPYFLVDRTLFLHHYLPAYVFKICLLGFTFEHIHYYLKHVLNQRVLSALYIAAVVVWALAVVYVFTVFVPVTYGHVQLTADQVNALTWRKSWDLIVHKR